MSTALLPWLAASALCGLIVFTVLLVLDRTQGRIERWLFAPQIRLRVPVKRSTVVPFRSRSGDHQDERVFAAIARGRR